MIISLIIFILTKKQLPSPAQKEKGETVNYTAEEKKQMATEIKQRMYALFAVLGIAIFVIVLTPVVMWVFSSLSRRGKEISTPRKIAIGMGLAGLAYLFLAVFSLLEGYPSAETFKSLAPAVAEGMKTGPWVLFVLYFFLTVAELFISPLGLSFVSKVAPKHLQGLCQGLWLGATAVGNLLLWIGPLIYNACPIWVAWTVFLSVCLVSMGIMYSMVGWLERVTK